MATWNLIVLLPDTACLYSGPSPVDVACLRNHLLHACCYWYCACHQQDTAVWRNRTRYSFSNIRAVVYSFSSNMHSNLFGLRRIVLVSFAFFKRTGTRMIRTYSSYVVWSKTKMRCGLLYFEVLLLITGVRADPKYSYSHMMSHDMYVRIVTFDFSLKYFIFLVGTW